MTGARSPKVGPRREASPRQRAGSRESARWASLAAVFLLVLHASLLLWVSSRQSVTFDESFHLPAGVRILARGDFITSFAQPPLAKSLSGAAALLAGARVTADSVAGPGGERWVGAAFMRDNADRFQRVYGAGRLPMMALSVALGWLVWLVGRAWYGPRGGLLSLAAYVVSPEPLAHGSLVGVDMATGLTFFGAVLAFARFARTRGLGTWRPAAVWFAMAFLVRFSAVQLFPTCALLLVVLAACGGIRDPRRAWLGLATLAIVAWLALEIGYLGQGSFQAFGRLDLHSTTFTRLQHLLPSLPVPLPEAYVRGLDYLAYLGQPGEKWSYFLGQAGTANHVLYFPVAILVKYPIGLLALIGARAMRTDFWRRRARLREFTLLVPVVVVLGVAMVTNLDYGIRYVFPILPFLCVWVGGLLAPVRRAAGAVRPAPRAALAWALVIAAALETARAMPYPLSFFNLAGGGPGRGDRIVNDSNVDWGQGLIALRDELRRRGIGRVLLAYHGTVDPAIYGIDYIPYTGGNPGRESDWIAVSSYYFVGLPARMTTSRGQSEQPLRFDFHQLWGRTPDARPAGCMYLFRLR